MAKNQLAVQLIKPQEENLAEGIKVIAREENCEITDNKTSGHKCAWTMKRTARMRPQ